MCASHIIINSWSTGGALEQKFTIVKDAHSKVATLESGGQYIYPSALLSCTLYEPKLHFFLSTSLKQLLMLHRVTWGEIGKKVIFPTEKGDMRYPSFWGTRWENRWNLGGFTKPASNPRYSAALRALVFLKGHIKAEWQNGCYLDSWFFQTAIARKTLRITISVKKNHTPQNTLVA